MPWGAGSLGGLIGAGAAFPFSSRRMFFKGARRVLGAGGVLTMSDVPAERMPRGPLELAAGVTQLRLWGMRPAGAMSAEEIAAAVRRAGFTDVRAELCGERVIDPALAWARERLAHASASAPGSQVVVS